MNADACDVRLFLFLAEAAVWLNDIDSATLAIQRRGDDVDALGLLVHAAHGIKARAAALGLRAVVVEAQRLEWWALERLPSSSGAPLLALNAARVELRRLIDELTESLDDSP